MSMRCWGCDHFKEGDLYKPFLGCTIWPLPAAKWRMSNCPNATHLEKAVAAKKVVNALKASKRGLKQ